MPNFQNDPVVSVSNSTDTPAVLGEGSGMEGVRGVSHNAHGAVVGVNDFSPATPPGAGGNGGWFESAQGEGVRGWAKTPHHGGVVGVNTAGGFGVYGKSDDGSGVVGESTKVDGVFGLSSQAAGVHGRGPTGGLFEGGSVAAVHAVAQGNASGILAKASGAAGSWAGFFDGNVNVSQTVTTVDVLIAGSDCAEDFDIMSSSHIEPGTVMAIGDDARLVESHRAYDKRVAGIVSGAGDYKPGIVLGKDGSRKDRVPLALIGKVFCKVDATYAPIEVGDLLTTSPTQGYAMKAEDPSKAFGAVVGKALAPLKEGKSLLPILVALQ
jgi:hypothetical protein